MRGHAQGRGSPRVHPGLQDPVALSWGGVGSIQAEEWAERRDYMERKRVITLFDFQCQRSIFHVALCWEGNIQIFCTFHFSGVCWTFINKSAPVFLTSLCVNSQGNKTIQFLSLIEIHFPFKHKNIFPR